MAKDFYGLTLKIGDRVWIDELDSFGKISECEQDSISVLLEGASFPVHPFRCHGTNGIIPGVILHRTKEELFDAMRDACIAWGNARKK